MNGSPLGCLGWWSFGPVMLLLSSIGSLKPESSEFCFFNIAFPSELYSSTFCWQCLPIWPFLQQSGGCLSARHSFSGLCICITLYLTCSAIWLASRFTGQMRLIAVQFSNTIDPKALEHSQKGKKGMKNILGLKSGLEFVTIFLVLGCFITSQLEKQSTCGRSIVLSSLKLQYPPHYETQKNPTPKISDSIINLSPLRINSFPQNKGHRNTGQFALDWLKVTWA